MCLARALGGGYAARTDTHMHVEVDDERFWGVHEDRRN